MQVKTYILIVVDLLIMYGVIKLLYKSVKIFLKSLFDWSLPVWVWSFRKTGDYGMSSSIKLLIFSTTLGFIVWIEQLLFY